MKRHILTVLCVLLLLAGLLTATVAAADANTVAIIGEQSYDTLQKAVDAYATGDCIKLVKNETQAVTVGKDVYLDLNGYSVTGAVNVTAGTLYCMDSQTDDYTVEDSNGYGKLSSVTGNVAGIPVESTIAEDGYLMVTEDGKLSFHRVNLKLYAMTLRAEEVGLYYNSYFAGDELVEANVDAFGVALSVDGEITLSNINEAEKSTLDNFQSGDGANATTSTLLKNIMRPTNATLTNKRNSNLPVYGKAYIKTEDGYMLGQSQSLSLKDHLELANKDTQWIEFDAQHISKMVDMYKVYPFVMREWDIPKLESEVIQKSANEPIANGETLKILALTSSFGLNTTQLLYDVAVAEGYEPENVIVGRLYTSGCTLQKHVANAPSNTNPNGKPVYQYTKITGDTTKTTTPGKWMTIKEEGYATLLDGLLDEDWDIIFMQQGAAQAPVLSTYGTYLDRFRTIVNEHVTNPNAKFVWNMLWGYQGDSTQSVFVNTFGSDQMAMYKANVNAVLTYIVPRNDYNAIIPTGTVIQNARTSEFGDNLCRDTYHLNNYGGIMAAYGLFATLTGQKQLTEINIDAVYATNTMNNGIGGAAKITEPLTDTQKLIMLESVNNALANPFQVTESQYPAADNSSDDFTSNLSFDAGTTNAICPACDQKVTWTEVNENNLGELTTQGYFGVQLPTGTHHFYLSSDINFTAESASNAFLYSPGNSRNICLHLNGRNLTSTNSSVVTVAGTTMVNIMGTGTVTGNATMTGTNVNRGTTLQINSGSSASLNIYSGTYKSAANSTNTSVVSGWIQGGTINIHKDAQIIGNGNHAIYLNTQNTKSAQIVNIYGGTISGGDIYFDGATVDSTIGKSTLNLQGGNIQGGINVVGNTDVFVGGAPVVSGIGLKLASGMKITLQEMTTGAAIAIDASGAFTNASAKASAYKNYFTAVNESCKITLTGNVLYCQ